MSSSTSNEEMPNGRVRFEALSRFATEKKYFLDIAKLGILRVIRGNGVERLKPALADKQGFSERMQNGEIMLPWGGVVESKTWERDHSFSKGSPKKIRRTLRPSGALPPGLQHHAWGRPPAEIQTSIKCHQENLSPTRGNKSHLRVLKATSIGASVQR